MIGESKFDDHVNNVCNNECQKLNVPSRPATFINVNKRRGIKKAFMASQWILSLCLDVPFSELF